MVMNPGPVKRPLKVRDESEARSIAKNWLFHAECSIQDTEFSLDLGRKISTNSISNSLKKRFKKLGASLICSSFGKDSVRTQSSKADTCCHVWHGKVRYIEDKKVRKKIYPVYSQVIHIKKRFVYHKSKLCFLTEHCLARLLMKSEANNIQDLNQILSIYMDALLFTLLAEGRTPPEFIILEPEGFMVLVNGKESPYIGIPVAKTWIPRSHWNRFNKEKLSKLAGMIKSNGQGYKAVLYSANEADINIKEIETIMNNKIEEKLKEEK